MIAEPQEELERVLAVLPLACGARLRSMGYCKGGRPSVDPERALRRALGGPQQVGLVDLELDPERYHGRFITTVGPLVWHRPCERFASVGRVWIDSFLLVLAHQRRGPLPPGVPTRLSGVLLAEPQLRASYRAHHSAPGGYGPDQLFIAQLSAVAIQPEPR
jgi:hypothetical protein